MKVDYINAFLNAAKNVLETMAQVSVRPKTPNIKKELTSYGEITGIIGGVSKTIRGVMVVSFPEACILKIVANMLIEPVKEKIDDEIVDAVGELTNMICGGG